MKPKKVLKITGITLLVVIGALAAAPIVFEGKIKALIKKNINENLNAKFDFADASLSLLKNFPNASLTIDELSLINNEPFAGDTLLYVKKASLKMSVKELFKSEGDPMSIKGFYVDGAQANVLVNKDGKANYDIAKAGEEDTKSGDEEESSGFTFSVEDYAITNSRISYLDESSKMKFVLDDFNHSGSGDLSAETSELNTKTSTLVSFEMDSTNYLNKNSLKLDALIGIDLKESKYSFLDNEALINQLPLVFDGFVKVNENNQEVDIRFKTPSSDFKNFLAVIPEVYSKNIENVETTGNFEVQGFLKGIVDDTHIPTFDVLIASDNASFKYPDLPKSVTNINLATAIVNKTGITEDTYVDIQKLSFKIDQDAFSGKARIDQLMGNPKVNAEVKGRLNLANLSQAYPIDLEAPMKGILDADIKTQFDMASIENKQYANTRNEGSLSLSGFEYTSAEMKNPVAISKAAVTFNPNTVQLNELDAKTGQTDFKASGTINNLLGFMFNKENVEGNFNLTSNTFAINDFMMAEEEAADGDAKETTAEEQIKIPSFLDATINATAGKVLYDNLTLKNVKGTLIVKDEKASLVNVTSDLFDGQVSLNGSVSTKDETPDFDMDLGISAFDIGQSFNGLELFQALTPLASALQGKLNSNLSLKGKLNDDFTLNLATVSGNALAELLSTSLNPEKSQALSMLNSNLNFIDLSKIDLNKLKTTLSFDNGKVTVKPFQLKYQDIAIDVTGSHGFDKSMSYNATFNVPAKYLGSDVSNALAQLNEKEAKDVTVPITAALGGTFTKPTVSTDLKQAASNLTNQLISQQKDKLTQAGKDKVQDAIGNLLGGNKAADSTKVDSTQATKNGAVKEAATSVIKNIFGKKKKDTVN